MHALLEISCKDPSRFFVDLNADDRSLEVLVLDLSQQLLLTQLVNPQDVPNSGDEAALVLSEGQGDILARCRMKQLNPCAIFYESISLDEAECARAR
jgi:hypothetical protein